MVFHQSSKIQIFQCLVFNILNDHSISLLQRHQIAAKDPKSNYFEYFRPPIPIPASPKWPYLLPYWSQDHKWSILYGNIQPQIYAPKGKEASGDGVSPQKFFTIKKPELRTTRVPWRWTYDPWVESFLTGDSLAP